MTGSQPRRWLVTGAAGMLGHDVVAALQGPAGHDVLALGRAHLDVTDAGAVAAAVEGRDVVVNCAGWTAVDDAETQEAAAFAANAVGPQVLARTCADAGARLVHVSTDYVFPGDAATPYAEDAPLAPRSAYGRTKAAGEWAVRAHAPELSYVVRTAWLYGEHGPSLPATLLRAAASRDVLHVVDDQRGQPTWSREVAARIVELVRTGAPPGTYHATASGETTWYGLTRRLFALAGLDPERVRRTDTASFPRPAPRPPYSVLGHDRWAVARLPPLRPWDEALAEAVLTGVFTSSL